MLWWQAIEIEIYINYIVSLATEEDNELGF